MTTPTQVRFLPVNTFAEQVAARIRAEAGARGIRPTDVARELGQAQGPISLKWRGLRAWKLEDIEAVARILRTTPSELCAVPQFLEGTVEAAGLGAYREMPERLTADALAAGQPVETTEALARLDEGSDTVRHQGLEPRTR